MNLTAPFIARPKGTSLLALALCLAGFLAFVSLPVAPLPRIEFPTIHVSASLPGASPETMATAVATPLERRFGRIAGVNEMTSSSSDGYAYVILQFDLARDIHAAARDVQAAIQASLADLPANLPARPSLRKVNPSDAPMMGLALSCPDDALGALYDVAIGSLVPALSRIDGVGEVFVAGSQASAVRIRVDADRLAGASLSLADVRSAVAAFNARAPLGAFVAGPQTMFVQSDDQHFVAKDYEDVVLRCVDQQVLRLRDVAVVEDGLEDDHAAAWFDGQRGILLILRRQPGANVLETVRRVREILPSLQADLPTNATLEISLDQSHTIRASIAEVERSLVLSIALVVVVVFLFLRDLRASFLPSIAIPLSLLGTFVAMRWLGLSLDNLSLMALTVCVGFVVDDAIVVTETIVRRLERGESAKDAALHGTRDIGFTIVSITASLLAVFLPLLAMGGMVGRLFSEFSLVLSIAVVLSAVVSLTVTPSLGAVLLQRPRSLPAHRCAPHPSLWLRLYRQVLLWSLRYPWVGLAVLLGSMALSAQQFRAMPKGLFPQQDNGMLLVMTQGPEDTSFQAMADKQRRVLSVFEKDPDVKHTLGFVSGNSGMGFVSLQPRDVRSSPLATTLSRLRGHFSTIAGVRVFLTPSQDLRVGARSSKAQYQVSLQAKSLADVRAIVPSVEAALKQVPEIRDVVSDLEAGGRELFVSMDRDAAAQAGLSMRDVDSALYDAVGQRQVSTVFGASSYRRVILSMLPPPRQSNSLSHLWVPSKTGPVPLDSLASTHLRPTSLSVGHDNQWPAVTISFDLAAQVSLGEAQAAVVRAIEALRLPEDVHAEFAGTTRAFSATQQSIPWLLFGALLAMYIVLGVLYENLWHPLTIVSTLPSAGLGALLMLRIYHEEFGILAFIGLVLLIGIVKKNAIMVVDVAIVRQREHGDCAHDAIVTACLERCRPILMTTAAALLGAVPLALGSGVGSELRRPLGLALVGGLFLSQWVTLLSTPVVYLLLERFRLWIAGRWPLLRSR